MNTKKISKKDTFAEAFEKNPDAARILSEEGLMCASCPMAMHETIEQGSKMHGANTKKIINRMNKKKKRRSAKRK